MEKYAFSRAIYFYVQIQIICYIFGGIKPIKKRNVVDAEEEDEESSPMEEAEKAERGREKNI